MEKESVEIIVIESFLERLEGRVSEVPSFLSC